jgi:hypothetical protein
VSFSRNYPGRLGGGSSAALVRLNHTPQGRKKIGSAQAKFGAMVQGKVLQYLFTFWSQGKQDFATIIATPLPPHIPARRETVYKFNRTVMSNLEPLGQLANPRAHASGQPLQGEQQLVLVRFKTSRAGGLFTEVKKPANLITQFRQRLVVSGGEHAFHTGKYSASRISTLPWFILIPAWRNTYRATR